MLFVRGEIVAKMNFCVCDPKKWWVVLLNGLLVLAFGLVLVINPIVAENIFLRITGIFIIISSVVGLFHLNDMKKFGVPAFVGGLNIVTAFLGIIVGLFVVTQPFQALVVFFIMIGVWLILAGSMAVYAIHQSIKGDRTRNSSACYGWFMIVLGILFFLFPATSGITLMYVVGFWTILMSIYMIVASFQIKKNKTINI
jgi:uncharacterized membrane protein HdeD (DUF308 family)